MNCVGPGRWLCWGMTGFLRYLRGRLSGHSFVRACGFLAIVLLCSTGAARALELMFVHQPGCTWCAAWEREIEPIYPKTEEGQRAPLRRWQLHTDLPEDVTLDTPALFTPTFILLDDGREMDRLEGYPGADFFWPILGRMLDRQEPNDP